MRVLKTVEKIRITENDPTSLVEDFQTYLTYLKTNPIKLTKTHGYLTKKDLVAIYPKLKCSEGDVPKQLTQIGFPILHLFYCLSIELDFIRIKRSKTTKSALIQTEQIERYLSLTSTEQYLTLLEAFWLEVDWEELQGESSSQVPDNFDLVVEDLERLPANKKLLFTRYKTLENGLFNYGQFYYYFKYFGFWTFELDEERSNNLPGRTYKTRAKSITLTSFFKKIQFALLETYEPYEDERLYRSLELFSKLFGQPTEDDDIWNPEEEQEEENPETLFSLLRPLFPSHELNTILKKRNDAFTGTFQFKVELSSNCWRILQLSTSHTLLDLHSLIQDAFDFDDDHLYTFYMDGKKFGKRAYNAPMDDVGPFVHQVKLKELNLYEGQIFLYLFDFGDEWEFDVHVMKMMEGEESGHPKIIQEHGAAPDQYGW